MQISSQMLREGEKDTQVLAPVNPKVESRAQVAGGARQLRG